jgi:hypothetical protein
MQLLSIVSVKSCGLLKKLQLQTCGYAVGSEISCDGGYGAADQYFFI